MSGFDKKQPVRMCIACRTRKPKQGLIRIVRRETDGEYRIDGAGKMQTRGTYLCANMACIAKAKKIFPKVKRCAMNEALYEALMEAAADDEQ